jgi:hypothetical protein
MKKLAISLVVLCSLSGISWSLEKETPESGFELNLINAEMVRQIGTEKVPAPVVIATPDKTGTEEKASSQVSRLVCAATANDAGLKEVILSPKFIDSAVVTLRFGGFSDADFQINSSPQINFAERKVRDQVGGALCNTEKCVVFLYVYPAGKINPNVHFTLDLTQYGKYSSAKQITGNCAFN